MKNKLKVSRAHHQFTQADLADRVGVSRQSIHAIESGKYIPSTVLALKIAIVLGETVEDLFTLEPEEITGLDLPSDTAH